MEVQHIFNNKRLFACLNSYNIKRWKHKIKVIVCFCLQKIFKKWEYKINNKEVDIAKENYYGKNIVIVRTDL